jgi:hypothetical protein
MAPRLPFRDTVTFYDTTKNTYGTDVATECQVATMGGLFVQVLSNSHTANQDAITSQSSVHLPPDNAYILANYVRLEGMVVSISLFEAPDVVQFFRITSCTIARDVLLGNRLQHIECILKKIAKPKYAS